MTAEDNVCDKCGQCFAVSSEFVDHLCLKLENNYMNDNEHTSNYYPVSFQSDEQVQCDFESVYIKEDKSLIEKFPNSCKIIYKKVINSFENNIVHHFTLKIRV